MEEEEYLSRGKRCSAIHLTGAARFRKRGLHPVTVLDGLHRAALRIAVDDNDLERGVRAQAAKVGEELVDPPVLFQNGQDNRNGRSAVRQTVFTPL
jgi:hypothetical protein